MTKNSTKSNTVLLTVAAVADILVATRTIAAPVTQPASAQSIAPGVNVTQQEDCPTAGGASACSASCIASSIIDITGSGGVLGKSADSSISTPTTTTQTQSCHSAGGICPITGSCTAASTNTATE